MTASTLLIGTGLFVLLVVAFRRSQRKQGPAESTSTGDGGSAFVDSSFSSSDSCADSSGDGGCDAGGGDGGGGDGGGE
jgi:hypothetical protein